MDASCKFPRETAGPKGVDRRLARIADLTGVPVEAFFAAAGPPGPPALSELVRLWERVGDAEGRAAILACARAVATLSEARAAAP